MLNPGLLGMVEHGWLGNRLIVSLFAKLLCLTLAKMGGLSTSVGV